MARSLGELFPVITAVLGVYFLLGAMFASTVVTRDGVAHLPNLGQELPVIAEHVPDGGGYKTLTVLVGVNPAPGLYAIASALCFGSVLVWSRLSPPKPARTTAAED